MTDTNTPQPDPESPPEATSPPATIGIIGGGQLAQMLAIAARAIDPQTQVRVYDPEADACAQREAPLTVGGYDDLDAIRRFADGCSVITCEFESVPPAALRAAAEVALVRPNVASFEIARDRLRERQLFDLIDIPTPNWRRADTLDAVRQAIDELGRPVILKRREGGYDGKGQAIIRDPADAERAWNALGQTPAIVDEFVPFSRELSLVGARRIGDQAGRGGDDFEHAWYPLVENTHADGILVETVAPAPNVDAALNDRVQQWGRSLMTELGHLGVLAIEFFEIDRGAGPELIANEFAPRVHNTGHWTIEGARLSQFELHLRAILGLPLGDTGPHTPAQMTNIIGQPLTETPTDAAVHMYGKEPRAGRKLGHFTTLEPAKASTEAST